MTISGCVNGEVARDWQTENANGGWRTQFVNKAGDLLTDYTAPCPGCNNDATWIESVTVLAGVYQLPVIEIRCENCDNG